MLIVIRKDKMFKVYRQTNYPNGWRRELIRTFKTSEEAKRFANP